MIRKVIICLMLSAIVLQLKSQTTSSIRYNAITTAVPFLTICPDARSTGMACTGAATTPDIFSQAHNPAKYVFFRPKYSDFDNWNYKFLFKNDTCALDQFYKDYLRDALLNQLNPDFSCIDSTVLSEKFSVALSFTPWLRELADDINLAYLVGVYRIDWQQTVSASLRYFSLGEIQFMSEYGDQLGKQKPNEFAIDLSYSKQLSKVFSGAITFRYIRSDLTSGQYVNGAETHAGTSSAVDISFFYYNRLMERSNESGFSAGLSISNIGTKISYTDGETKDFLPTNLNLGFAYSSKVDDNNTISFSLDFNKLLVPTPDIISSNVVYGFGDDRSIIDGIITSFTDAPGGLKEEIQEIIVSGGIEFTYNQNFFFRTGYFNESKYKGNRKYLSVGLGANLIYNKRLLSLDLAYLIPLQRNNPLANTCQISMAVNL